MLVKLPSGSERLSSLERSSRSLSLSPLAAVLREEGEDKRLFERRISRGSGKDCEFVAAAAVVGGGGKTPLFLEASRGGVCDWAGEGAGGVAEANEVGRDGEEARQPFSKAGTESTTASSPVGPRESAAVVDSDAATELSSWPARLHCLNDLRIGINTIKTFANSSKKAFGNPKYP